MKRLLSSIFLLVFASFDHRNVLIQGAGTGGNRGNSVAFPHSNIFQRQDTSRVDRLQQINTTSGNASKLDLPCGDITVSLLRDIAPGNKSSSPQKTSSTQPYNRTGFLDRPFFMFTAFTDEHGYEPWIYHDNEVRILKDIYPGPESGIPVETSSKIFESI